MVEDASGKRRIRGFDNMVLALGSKADDRIVKRLQERVPELYVIGDASQPRQMLEALYGAEEIALTI